MPDAFERLLSALPLPAGYQLTAQGCYRYWLNGELQAISEPWLHAVNAAGQQLTHSARFVEALQLALLVTQQQSPAGSFCSELRWQQAGQTEISARYQYSASEQRLQLSRSDEAGLSSTEQQLAPAFLYFPLLRVFSGQLIRQLAQHGPQLTLVPDIQDPANRAALLRLTQSQRSAELQATERIEINGQSHQALRYRYLSERYQPQDDASFWLDPDGLLLKYSWQQNPQQLWQVELHQHQCSTAALSNTAAFVCP